MCKHRIARRILLLLLPGVLFAQDHAFPTLTVEPQTVPVERSFDGTVEAVHQATVSSQLAGRIEEVMFDVDDFVSAGDVLLRFRSPEQQAGVARAQANLHEAEARDAEASAEYARIKDIFGRKLVSKSAMDKAEAEYKAARARLKAARAALAQAQEQLEHTLVRAPYSGIVTQRHVETGETATIGQPLMSGISLDKLRVTTQVPQSDVEAIRRHHRASIRIPQTDAPAMSSDAITVFPYADSASHSFRVRVDLPQGTAGLYPGMLVKVAFTVAEQQQLRIPSQAVVARSELTGVYVLDDAGQLQLRQVRLGDDRNGEVEVLAGLSPGEVIALDPVAAGIQLKSAGPEQP